LGEIPALESEFQGDRDMIIVYCHTGVRSMHVCQFLEQQSLKNVLNLNGGIHWLWCVLFSLGCLN
jgi:rhodanese-related sulfurtransferase